MPRTPEEGPDIDLSDELLFRPRSLVLQPFTQDELALATGELVAFCEIKSPRDDWLDEQLEAAPAFAQVGGARSDPTFNRIARHVQAAARQFDAVNGSRQYPNILVFVNHDVTSRYADLREVLTGYFEAATGERFPTMKYISERTIQRAKQRVDLYTWIDVRSRRLQGHVFNQGASPDHVQRLCALLSIDPSSIRS
jgi:hypothetical protein